MPEYVLIVSAYPSAVNGQAGPTLYDLAQLNSDGVTYTIVGSNLALALGQQVATALVTVANTTLTAAPPEVFPAA